MAIPDSEKERLRLEKVYGRMLDGELCHVAEDAESLTDVARAALEAEISRRGLSLRPEPEPTSPNESAPVKPGVTQPEIKVSAVANYIGTPSEDPEEIRLQKVYGDMLDGELVQVAEDRDSLTAEALAALRTEMASRGLNVDAVPKRVSKQRILFEKLYSGMLDAELLDLAP